MPLHTKRSKVNVILKQVSIKFGSMTLKLLLLPDPFPLIIFQSKDIVSMPSYCRNTVEIAGITIQSSNHLARDFWNQRISSFATISQYCFQVSDWMLRSVVFHPRLTFLSRSLSFFINSRFLAKMLPKTLLFQSFKIDCLAILSSEGSNYPDQPAKHFGEGVLGTYGWAR